MAGDGEPTVGVSWASTRSRTTGEARYGHTYRMPVRGLGGWIADKPRLTGLSLGNLHGAGRGTTLERLGGVPEEVFGRTGLAELTLSTLDLTQLPAGLAGMTSLVSLSLPGNSLRELPAALAGLAKLRRLRLGTYGKSAAPSGWRSQGNPDLGRLDPALRELDLHVLDATQCGLTQLDDVLPGWTGLRELRLPQSALRSLPPTIGAAAALRVLDVSAARELHELPPAIGDLPALAELDLSYTPLRTVPRPTGSLGTLQHLRLTGTQLTALPAWTTELTALDSIRFGRGALASYRDAAALLTRVVRPVQVTMATEHRRPPYPPDVEQAVATLTAAGHTVRLTVG